MSQECKFEQEFDARRMIQYVNGEPSVMHCHHYATLYTRLAVDMAEFDGARLLRESMEESIYLVLKKYFITESVSLPEDKRRTAERMCGLMGLGSLELQVGGDGGSAVMRTSHLDEGWIKKWGRTDHEVNFMGQGYILACFDALNNAPVGSYEISESRSIVKGDHRSEFVIKRAK